MMWRAHCSSCSGLPVDVAPEEKALLRAGWSRLGLEWPAIAVDPSRAKPTSESVKSTAAACLLWLPFVGVCASELWPLRPRLAHHGHCIPVTRIRALRPAILPAVPGSAPGGPMSEG